MRFKKKCSGTPPPEDTQSGPFFAPMYGICMKERFTNAGGDRWAFCDSNTAGRVSLVTWLYGRLLTLNNAKYNLLLSYIYNSIYNFPGKSHCLLNPCQRGKSLCLHEKHTSSYFFPKILPKVQNHFLNIFFSSHWFVLWLLSNTLFFNTH